MNIEVKQQWVAALRSGEYQQGRGVLRKDDKFCCLGVLCDISELYTWSDKGRDISYGQHVFTLPNAVKDWAGLEENNPVLPGYNTLSNVNDAGKSFQEIADIIEREL